MRLKYLAAMNTNSNSGYDRCATCGHRRRDHFYGTGLCNLGFCASHCGEFVEPDAE